MSEEKFEFEAMWIGRPVQFERFVKGEWTSISVEEAKKCVTKLDFKVRNTQGKPIDDAYFQAQSDKEKQEAMRTYAQREYQAERLSARTTLRPNGKQGPVPHDEGYVAPQEEVLGSYGGLPPAGFEYVEGAPKKAYKGTIPSQRFDPGQAQELVGLRLTPRDDPRAAINTEAAVRAEQAGLAAVLAKTSRQSISRA